MSFEGFYRMLCKNGHLGHSDCYTTEPENWHCHICGESCAWWELIDQTNGYDPKSETKLRIKEKEKIELCECCGEFKTTKHQTYQIPKSKGHKV